MQEDPRLEASLTTDGKCAPRTGAAKETRGRNKQKCNSPNTEGTERR